MEIRQWALRIFGGDTLEEKLLAPPGGLKGLTDRQPGPAQPWSLPARPDFLRISDKRSRLKFPQPQALERSEMRARCLHVFANHELMALEMMAWALLAFPQAEATFRLGLAKVLLDEQRHFQLYSERLQELGVPFGELPVNDHFWRSGAYINSPLEWVCTMHLTFEQSNLDHAPYFEQLFTAVEDHASAQLMRQIFLDEIQHVRFGSRWLQKLQPSEQSSFETFASHCTWGNPPARAKGPVFQAEARRRAGLDADFIARLERWSES